MANPSRYSVTGDDAGVESDRDGGMPRWVKVLIGIGIVLIILFVLMINGVFGGEHGPGRHIPAGAGAAPAVAPGDQVPDGGHDPSMGDHG